MFTHKSEKSNFLCQTMPFTYMDLTWDHQVWRILPPHLYNPVSLNPKMMCHTYLKYIVRFYIIFLKGSFGCFTWASYAKNAAHAELYIICQSKLNNSGPSPIYIVYAHFHNIRARSIFLVNHIHRSCSNRLGGSASDQNLANFRAVWLIQDDILIYPELSW